MDEVRLEEKGCPRCGGSGYVDASPGDPGAYSQPKWSRQYGRAQCGRCQGRGYLLFSRNQEMQVDNRTPVESQPIGNAPVSLYEGHQAAHTHAPNNERSEARRIFCLHVAMQAYSLSSGGSSPFSGGAKPLMDDKDIVAMAREVEMFIRGD